jgi:hypothetical protein
MTADITKRERQFNLQWILYRRKAKTGWRAVSFVAWTRQVLERCMREKGCEPSTAKNLLAELPDTFDQRHTSLPPPKPRWPGARRETDNRAERPDSGQPLDSLTERTSQPGATLRTHAGPPLVQAMNPMRGRTYLKIV